MRETVRTPVSVDYAGEELRGMAGQGAVASPVPVRPNMLNAELEFAGGPVSPRVQQYASHSERS